MDYYVDDLEQAHVCTGSCTAISLLEDRHVIKVFC